MDRIDPRYAEAIRYLYDRINYEKSSDRPYNQQTFRLGRMEYLLAQLGSPQHCAPVIHVAGTKGKGSVSWLLAEAFRRSGLRVGLYTSPHLIQLEERFVVDGKPCEPQELVDQIDFLKEADRATSRSSQGQPTFFEMTTALAWTLFALRKTDVNVIEVGLGGRLDSTNVCKSSLSIITSISFDHQQQLGNTISLIATEKAGIIKNKVPVVSGARHPDAAWAVQAACKAMCSDLLQIGRDFEVSKTPTQDANRLRFNSSVSSLKPEEFDNVELRMVGRHQGDNAAIAIAAWQRLRQDGWKLSSQPMIDSLAQTQVSCRIEQVANEPTVIIDTAHNEASIQALVDTLEDRFPSSKKTIVFACSKDKEVSKMVLQLLENFDRIVLTQFQNNPRAVLLERLEEITFQHRAAFPKVEIFSASTSDLAVRHAIDSAVPNELICIAGSFFLASETRPMFPPSLTVS